MAQSHVDRAPAPGRGSAVLGYLAVGLAFVLVGVLASRAGPLQAHPRDFTMSPPPPMPQMTFPEIVPPASGGSSGGEVNSAVLTTVAVALGAVLLVILIRYLLRVLRRPGRVKVAGLDPAWRTLTPVSVGLADGDAEADQQPGRSFDVRRSADDIIATWTAVERAAAALGGGRLASQTPTEFVAACVDRWGSGGRGDSEVLLGLYHRARFDTAQLALGAASEARRAGRHLIETWTRRAGTAASDAVTPTRVEGTG